MILSGVRIAMYSHNRRSGNRTLTHRIILPGTLAAFCLALSACSDGGDVGDSSGLVPPGDSNATPADQLTTEEILQGAADTTSSGLGQRLVELQDSTDDALTELESGSPVAGMVDETDTTVFTDLDTRNTALLSTSLGVDGSTADVSRTGNTITIDPDEQALCADTEGSSPEQGITTCSQLMADLTVRVEASTEDSGVITYLFRNEPLLSIGYAPTGVIYELELTTLNTVVQAEADLSEDEDAPGASISGTVRLSALLLSEGTSDESAELSLQIVNPLSVVDNSAAQTLLSLQPSTVFQINTETASETVVTKVDWGALQLSDEFLDSENNNNSLMLNLGKLTGQVSASGSGAPVQISNVGIGDVPLTVTINSADSLSFGLDTFGASLDNDTGILTLTSALGLRYVVDNLAGTIEGLPEQYRLSISASAPAGTGFQAQDNGSTKVTSGGPLTATSVSVSNDSTQSSQQETTVQAGECFDDVEDEDTPVEAGMDESDDADSLIPMVVPCS